MLKLKEGIVLRNIDGIYFLVDIHEKHYYDIRNIYSLNQIGAEVFNIIRDCNYRDAVNIANCLFKKLIGVTDKDKPKIIKDINAFINELLEKEFLMEENSDI